MKKIKKLNNKKEEFNPKNKNHRAKLYERTFMQHNVESRLFTLQEESINLTLQTAAVALDPSKANLLNLAEAIADVETATEFTKHSIPKLQEASTNIKYNKLHSLKERTDKEENEALIVEPKKDQSEEEIIADQQKKAEREFEEAKTEHSLGQFALAYEKEFPEKKGFFHFFRYLRKYFK